ncbi:MAG: DUF6338 family protein [Gemmataceae bacterium]
MPATLLALQIFLILLPGFSAAYIVQALATRRSQSDLERVIEALVFSFIIYVCYVPVNAGRLPFHLASGIPNGGETIVWEPRQLGWLALVTAGFSFTAVAYVRFDGNRIFQWLRLSERTTRNSMWDSLRKPSQPRTRFTGGRPDRILEWCRSRCRMRAALKSSYGFRRSSA